MMRRKVIGSFMTLYTNTVSGPSSPWSHILLDFTRITTAVLNRLRVERHMLFPVVLCVAGVAVAPEAALYPVSTCILYFLIAREGYCRQLMD